MVNYNRDCGYTIATTAVTAGFVDQAPDQNKMPLSRNVIDLLHIVTVSLDSLSMKELAWAMEVVANYSGDILTPSAEKELIKVAMWSILLLNS